MRRILGFAVLAVVAWLVLKIFFGILTTLIGLAITVGMLALFGYVVYLVLRVLSPGLADKVRGMMSGAPKDDERVPR